MSNCAITNYGQIAAIGERHHCEELHLLWIISVEDRVS